MLFRHGRAAERRTFFEPYLHVAEWDGNSIPYQHIPDVRIRGPHTLGLKYPRHRLPLARWFVPSAARPLRPRILFFRTTSLTRAHTPP